jgi:hypothetical protein
MKTAHRVTRFRPNFIVYCSGNNFHRYKPFLGEIGLYSRFSGEHGAYYCDEHARMTDQIELELESI